MSGVIWSKLFWPDWESDQRLKLCSLAAQGLWMRVLCICAQSERCAVEMNGRPLSTSQVAVVVGRPEREVSRLLAELDGNGVFSRDDDGAIFSRRMRRDANKRAADRTNGRRGGNPALKGGVNPPSNPPDKGEDKAHKPRARSQEKKLSQEGKPSFESAADGGVRPVSKADLRQIVESLWTLQPVLGGKRRATRPDVAKALAAAVNRGCDPAEILAAATAYYRLPDCTKDGGQFAKGADALIAADRWRDFLPGGATVAPLHTWAGPARIREAVVDERGEPFARSYLDPATWVDPAHEADAGTILCATGLALARLKEVRALADVSLIVADRRAVA